MADRKKFLRKSRMIYAGILILVVLLNVASWNSTLFSDWYIKHIFSVWVNVYGRVTGLFPFSVGEWMLAAGVILVVLAVAMGLIWAVIGVAAGVHGIYCDASRRKAGLEGERVKPTDMSQGSSAEQTGLTAEAEYDCVKRTGLTAEAEYDCVEQTGLTAEAEGGCVERTGLTAEAEGGCTEQTGLAGAEETAGSGQQRIFGGFRRFSRGFGYFLAWTVLIVCLVMTLNYPQLDGYYPRPKALLSSDFMCQQYMQGYYFPFSMEANYNDVMHVLNFPSTMCHELAHLRGYIYEDEANFIGYLACVGSEDVFFQYVGYLSVLVYLNNDLYKAWKEERAAYEEAVAAVSPTAVDVQVWKDNIFVTEEEWERINGKALIDTEIVDKAADVFIDTNLKMNGIADGKISYSRVVRLLLQYYWQQPSLLQQGNNF